MHFLEVLARGMRRGVGQGRLRAGRAPAAAAWSWSTATRRCPASGSRSRWHGHDVVDGRGPSRGHAAHPERSVRARRRRPVRLLHPGHHRPRGVADRARADRTIARAVAKALDGHLCRCTGYGRIIDAIQTAGEACRNGGWLPSTEPRRHSYLRRRVRPAPQSGVRERQRPTATATASADRSRGTAGSSRRSARSRSSTTCACPACCTARWC